MRRAVERHRLVAFATGLAKTLDVGVSGFSVFFGRVALPLIIICGMGTVVGRHLRIGPSAELKELESILFFAILMLSFGYAYLRNAHVRIDIVSQHVPVRTRAAIELLGCVAVVFPFCLVLMWDGGESAWRSFAQGERLAIGDWPLQWLVRLAVPLGALLLLAAAVAISARCLLLLLASRGPGATGERVPTPFDHESAP